MLYGQSLGRTAYLSAFNHPSQRRYTGSSPASSSSPTSAEAEAEADSTSTPLCSGEAAEPVSVRVPVPDLERRSFPLTKFSELSETKPTDEGVDAPDDGIVTS